MQRVWVFFVAFFSTLTSCVASGCLFIWLYGIRHANKRKLMWRQLKQLALADIVYSAFATATMVMDALSTPSLPLFWRRTDPLVRACGAVGLVYSAGFYTSLIIEAHLAVCTAAAICRWTSCLKVLRKCLVMAWPLGALMALADLVVVGINWKFGQGCVSQGRDVISVGSAAFCVVVALAAYTCSLVQACRATRVVRHRIWHQTQYYLLVMIVCLSPNLVRISTSMNSTVRCPLFHLVSMALFNFRGLANTLVYAVQSHYIRKVRGRQGQQAEATKRSFSFHVAMGPTDVVDITPIAAEALAQSERETAVLEVASEADGSTPSTPDLSFTDQRWRASDSGAFPGSLQGPLTASLASSRAGHMPPRRWGPPPGSPAPSRRGSGISDMDGSLGSEISEDDFLDCFEAAPSPADVRRGLNFTLSVADGLGRRDREPPRTPPTGLPH